MDVAIFGYRVLRIEPQRLREVDSTLSLSLLLPPPLAYAQLCCCVFVFDSIFAVGTRTFAKQRQKQETFVFLGRSTLAPLIHPPFFQSVFLLLSLPLGTISLKRACLKPGFVGIAPPRDKPNVAWEREGERKRARGSLKNVCQLNWTDSTCFLSSWKEEGRRKKLEEIVR